MILHCRKNLLQGKEGPAKRLKWRKERVRVRAMEMQSSVTWREDKRRTMGR